MSRDWSKEADACDEFVQSAYEYYSVDTVAELLLPTGLLIDKSTQYSGTFERYVFLNGSKDEIYTRQEIDFISVVGDIAAFTEFHKETKRGIIPCKVIVARNSTLDPVDFSIAFTKINNKASDDFNICVVFSEEGIIFACRSYDDSTSNNYHISDIIKNYGQMEEMYDSLVYSSEYDGFIDYYSYVQESIRFKTDAVDCLSKFRNAHRLAYAYMDELWEIENATGLSFSRKIEKCFWGLEEQRKETYADWVAEADEYLFKVESSRINTIEMLFEAEEMEKLALEAEQRNEMMLMQNSVEDDKSEEIDTKTKALLEDPESMIKLLKKKRGI